MKSLRIVMLGPQGAGKGTQASRLSRKYGIPHISPGNVFREEIARGSALGKKVSAIDRGQLISDALVNRMIKQRLQQSDCRRGWILDGYPRTLAQARVLDRFSPPNILLHLHFTDRIAVQRLSGRRLCPHGHIYHLRHDRPKRPGRCDIDGLPITQRVDDKPAAIRRRLGIYHRITKPILHHFGHRWNMVTVDAHLPIKTVYRHVLKALP